jgi:hypothetical protein
MAAPSSATDRAPNRLINPPKTQTASIKDVEPVSRAIVAGTIKIPEPIIPPALIMVASSKVRTRASFGGSGLLLMDEK